MGFGIFPLGNGRGGGISQTNEHDPGWRNRQQEEQAEREKRGQVNVGNRVEDADLAKTPKSSSPTPPESR